MKASDLIESLKQLAEKHGDLPVTVALGNCEYDVSLPDHTEAGPLPNVGVAQNQNPPERFVIEADDLDE
jgi:hypothetical protein